MGQLTAPGTALSGPDGTSFVGNQNQVLDRFLGQAKNIRPVIDGVNPNAPSQSMSTPSFKDAATAGATPGGVNALSPGLTKAGKLVALLTSGLKGALAGRAASEQAVIQSGGRRSGGAGLGFESGYTEPAREAQLQQGIERGGLENQLLKSQVQYAPQFNFLKMLQGQAGVAKDQAEAGKARAETGAIPAKTALEQAQAEAANYKEDPNLGLIDLRTGQPVNPSAMAPLTAQEAQILGKQPGERVPLKLKNTANEIWNRGYTTLNTEEGVYTKNRLTGEKTREGANPRMMFAPSERYVPVADPNNPGVITYRKAGEASAQGLQAPQSAATTEAKAEARSEVPTKIGDQKVAFKTMIAHADLLRKAAAALNNGDVQALNSLQNSFKNAFGNPGPITAKAIADAYGGEVTNVISKGHITDKEMEKTGSTIDPSKQNYATIDSVLGAYQALAQSKLNMLQQQANAAKSGGSNSANDPAGIRPK